MEARLGNLAVRLEEHDKRLADHRAYFTTLSSIVGIVFTIVVASGSVIGYLQFSNEKAALESFKQQVREDIEQQLGKAKDSSEIEILTHRGLQKQGAINSKDDRGQGLHARPPGEG